MGDRLDSVGDSIMSMKPRLEAVSRTMVAMANITKNIIVVVGPIMSRNDDQSV